MFNRPGLAAAFMRSLRNLWSHYFPAALPSVSPFPALPPGFAPPTITPDGIRPNWQDINQDAYTAQRPLSPGKAAKLFRKALVRQGIYGVL